MDIAIECVLELLYVTNLNVYVLFCCATFGMFVTLKQMYTTKTLREKGNVLKDIERGISNKDVAKKYIVVKNSTLSTRIKNKDTLIDAYESGEAIRNEKGYGTAEHENVEKAVLKWLLWKGNQSLLLSGIIISAQLMQMSLML